VLWRMSHRPCHLLRSVGVARSPSACMEAFRDLRARTPQGESTSTLIEMEAG
jgi:hypothetical protein